MAQGAGSVGLKLPAKVELAFDRLEHNEVCSEDDKTTFAKLGQNDYRTTGRHKLCPK
jgi:hypothetical protein